MLLHIILLSSVMCAMVTQGTSNEVPTENVTQETADAPLGSTAVNACSESEWQCADGSCISEERKCDAKLHCKDGSDEFQDTCEGIERPIFELQMRCIMFSATTRRICPQICYDQPEFCTYALMAENGWPNTCRLPKYPAHGKYTAQPLENFSSGYRLDYTCDQSYVLVDTGKMECVNGTWVNWDKPRYCAETCRLYKSDEFSYVCQNSSCGDHVPVGAAVTVTRKQTGRDAVSIQILCNQDKVFNISTDCVKEIDNTQYNFENPTLVKMTSYEAKFNQMKTNETTSDFIQLLDDFHEFEQDLRGNLSVLYRLSEQCDIYLDLLLYDLSVKQKSMYNRR